MREDVTRSNRTRYSSYGSKLSQIAAILVRFALGASAKVMEVPYRLEIARWMTYLLTMLVDKDSSKVCLKFCKHAKSTVE